MPSLPVLSLALTALLAGAQPEPAESLEPPRPPPPPGMFEGVGLARWESVDDELVAELGAAFGPATAEQRDRILQSLRSLHDPRLAPLFARLATTARPVLRIHGILGLGELQTPPRVDLLLVRKVGEPQAQLVILGEALRAGMLEPEQLEDVSRWPNLDQTLAVLVLGRLQRAGGHVDADQFTQMLSSQNRAAAIFAALELVALGESYGVAGAPIDEILSLPPTERSDVLEQVLEYIRSQRLVRALPVVEIVVDQLGDDQRLRSTALGSALAIAPDAWLTRDLWSSQFAAEDTGGRIRLGLLALHEAIVQDAFPASLFEPLRAADSPLLKQIGDAGAAVTSDPLNLTPVLELVDQGHLQTAAWTLELAVTLEPPLALQIRQRVVAVASRRALQDPAFYELVNNVGRALAKQHPAELASLATSAASSDDRRLLTALLAGALESGAPADPSLIKACQGQGGISAALCRLLETRGSPILSPGDQESLVEIALARADVPDVVRVQAAWLALKARGQTTPALGRVLATLPE
ncbi:MAG: hypothetical protein H7Y88_09160 [Phycisphaerales bacterium]|nr:hypothetical protein [Phycisphaerales bacterium]